MREILFRGKRVDDGEWVEGFLSKGRLLGHAGNTLQPCIDREEKGVMVSSLVIPETVGQYTGKCTRDGTRVFEGDVLDVGGGYVDTVGFHNGCFVMENAIMFEELSYGLRGYKVVGNIHDNPDLLEGLP